MFNIVHLFCGGATATNWSTSFGTSMAEQGNVGMTLGGLGTFFFLALTGGGDGFPWNGNSVESI